MTTRTRKKAKAKKRKASRKISKPLQATLADAGGTDYVSVDLATREYDDEYEHELSQHYGIDGW